jgi:hypothetical protein
MIKTLRLASGVTKTSSTLLCLGLLALPITACGSSSSDGNNGGAGEGSVIGNAGSTSSAGASNGNTAGASNGNTAGASNGSAGSTGSGTMDAVTECTALYAAECTQAFKCLTADQLAQAAADIGTTEAECETNITDCSADAAACDAGETYHGDKAEACVNALATLSCADFMTFLGNETPPAVCGTVCQ